MNRFLAATYVGQLAFQGSDDNAAYTTIFTVGNELHEGWNYYDYEDGAEPRYRFYRFFGSKAGSCVVGEVIFTGMEAIDNSDATYDCTPSLIIDGTSFAVSNPVTYSNTYTPLLTSISPRYGSVKGSEVVTFTGTNLDSDYTKYTITIDKIACIPTEATTTYVKCTTGKRPGLVPDTSLEISISGKGKVST